ncbi:MAG: hypothetical protein IPL25_19110 [Saprospiraceae bacterium]|nr:hypothetical protein [Candidatus Vicinibacter affinis]
MQILLNNSSINDKKSAIEIIEFFDFLPFALEIANRHITEYNDICLSEFLKELKDSSLKWEGLGTKRI